MSDSGDAGVSSMPTPESSTTLKEMSAWEVLTSSFHLDINHKGEDILVEIEGDNLTIIPEKGEPYTSGDILSTMEVLLCEADRSSELEFNIWSRSSTPVSTTQDAVVTGNSQYISRSSNIFCSHSPRTRHRFLAVPYTGTGYLPTVIRPQNFIQNSSPMKDDNPRISTDNYSEKSSNSE